MELIYIVLCFILWTNEALSTETKCPGLPEVGNADLNEESQKDNYTDGDLLYFTCRVGYASTRRITYRCSNRRWIAVRSATCSPKPCELPEDTPNGRYDIVTGTDLVFGTVIKYTCNEGYQMVSRSDTRSCMVEGWSDHVPLCEAVKCVAEINDDSVIVSGLPDNKNHIESGHVLHFKCESSEQTLKGESEVVCLSNGTWSSQFPTCEVLEPVRPPISMKPQGYSCGPPPLIKYADIRGFQKDTYRHGERVEFQCQNFYKLSGTNTMQCQYGQWTKSPLCLEPCIVTIEEMQRRGVMLKYGTERKLYVPHEDRVQFVCAHWKSRSDGDLIQYCHNGKMHIPSCS
ncbi:complement factor H-related protein 2-like [Megalops cyprinoides]|uniref:complement factor H-related protein 2-like n=1 Tax=Megalops cyprinoides TaxID=118141 RepID=UPI0018656A93|nr:complement factor H-related protein 2-like [Megalops cyprinoides]